SIAAELSGMLSGTLREKRVERVTSRGMMSECRGTRSTSSKVRPSGKSDWFMGSGPRGVGDFEEAPGEVRTRGGVGAFSSGEEERANVSVGDGRGRGGG